MALRNDLYWILMKSVLCQIHENIVYLDQGLRANVKFRKYKNAQANTVIHQQTRNRLGFIKTKFLFCTVYWEYIYIIELWSAPCINILQIKVLCSLAQHKPAISSNFFMRRDTLVKYALIDRRTCFSRRRDENSGTDRSYLWVHKARLIFRSSKTSVHEWTKMCCRCIKVAGDEIVRSLWADGDEGIGGE